MLRTTFVDDLKLWAIFFALGAVLVVSLAVFLLLAIYTFPADVVRHLMNKYLGALLKDFQL